MGDMRVEYEDENPRTGVRVQVEVVFPVGLEQEAAGLVMEAANTVSGQISSS